MNHHYRYLLTASLLTLSVCLHAQNGINSPYSRYGFGIQSDRSMGFNKGMAGVAQGFRDGTIVNVANPASYSCVDSITAIFDFGISMYNGNYKMGSLQQNAKNTSLDYAAFHFRATRGLGITLGVLPYTNINYQFSSGTEALTGNDDMTSAYTFSGDGGLHQVFLGAGWQVFKPISIGMNGGYLFGDYTHTMTMAFSDANAYSLIRGYSANISTWIVDFGLQYTQPLGKKDKFTIGISYGLGHDINNRATRYTETYNSSTSTAEGISRDTLHNAFQLPHTFSAGITYYRGNKLRIGADAELQKWSKCKFPAQDMSGTGEYVISTGGLNDKLRFAVGADYLPKATGRFFQRITYKAGAYYSRTYANADPTGTITDKPFEYGISAGVSLPISNANLWYNDVPKLHFSVQWIHTDIPYLSSMSAQPHKATLTENYIKFSVGLTFSERWFFKWKVD